MDLVRGVLGQKYRFVVDDIAVSGGYQGKAADVFAFGRVIQRDVLNTLIMNLGEALGIPIVPFVLEFLMPRSIPPRKFSDKELQSFQEMNPGRVVHIGVNPQGLDVILIYDTSENIYRYTLQILDRLEKASDRIPSSEFLKLRELARLAKDLQEVDKEVFLTSLKVRNEDQKDDLMAEVQRRIAVVQGVSDQSVSRKLSFARRAEDEEDPIEDTPSSSLSTREHPAHEGREGAKRARLIK